MLRKVLLTVALSFFLINIGYSSHLMGGEITWVCQANGLYVFKMKLYRDCNGIQGPGSVTLAVHNNPSLASIPLSLVSQTDISPNGPGCPTCPTGGQGAVEEFVYQSAAIALPGVPPAQGWAFTYDDCCRNAAITNLNLSTGSGFTLRAIMFPYNGQNTAPCFDSSPVFVEKPSVIMCTRNPFKYNHNAVDTELDSLVYSWGQPLNNFSGVFNPPGNPTQIGFNANYSFSSPLPGPLTNPLNVPANMNTVTGEVGFTSYTAGNFVTVTKVTAFKCGIKVAEIYREIQIVLVGNCIITAGPPVVYNTDPDVTAPFQDATGAYTLYNKTVCAGEPVSFFLNATDFEFLPLAAPTFGAPQVVTITASGSQFGAGFNSTTTGCFNPPCATLAPPTPISAPFGVGVNFNWQTDCNHLPKNLGCVTLSSTYNFVIKAFDNFCPAPAINFSTISITVVAPPVLPGPSLRCIASQPNGSNVLTWVPPVLTTVCENMSFHAYDVYTANTPAGPFNFLDSLVGNINNVTYTHNAANACAAPVYYFVATRSGCDKFILNPNQGSSDTLRSIKLTVTNPAVGVANLAWNNMHTPNIPSASGWYRIYRKIGIAGAWNLIDSTQALTYNNPVTVCNDTIMYRIEMMDASGCISISCPQGKQFVQPAPVINPPSPRCVAVNQPTGSVTLTWVQPVDTGQYFASYLVYHSTALAGPYTLLQTVPTYATTSYTHAAANGNAQINYYHVKTVAGCDPVSVDTSVASVTLASMLLTATPSTGFATLNWNPIRTPLLATTQLPYKVFRNVNSTGWVQIGTSNTTSYVDTITQCNVPISYRVDIPDASGCVSISSVASGIFTYQPPLMASPSLRCVSVLANGDVTLNWVLPPNPLSLFIKYYVYHSLAAGGPFVKLDSVIAYATTSYTQVGANGNNQVNYYYLVTVSGCPNAGLPSPVPSQTLASIRLIVTPTVGFATLNWNALRAPLPTTSQGFYRVYKQIPPGGWAQIATTTSLTYVDTITQCNIPINYRVEVVDSSGCTSVSSVASGVFTFQPPLIASPSLRCVSVLTNGNVTLTWVLPADPNNFFRKYVIYHSLAPGGPFTILDSVMTYATTTYTHVGANGNAQANYYYMVSHSGCPGAALPSPVPSLTLASMRLTVTPAVGFATLNWNALRAPLPPTSQGFYRVFRQNPTGVGAWTQIGTTTALTYVDTITQCNVPISYRVEVVDSSGCTSVSSVASGTFTYQPPLIASPSLRCVSVLTNGNVTLTWVLPADPNNFFRKYVIYHSLAPGGPFAILDSVMTYATTTYTHVGANGNAQANYYYMVSHSGCTGAALPSPVPSLTLASMRLTVTPTVGFATLNWNALRAPLPPTSQGFYRVFRQNPTGVGAWTQIGTTTALTYVDTITQCNVPISYRVEVVDSSGCTSVSSVANGTFTYQPPLIASPSLRCVSVLASGDVTLTWVVPADPNNFFRKYVIYHSLAPGGPFTILDSVMTYATTSYTHVGANGNAQANYYYMVSHSGCPGAGQPAPVPSLTLASMHLTVAPALGFATLNWNALRAPLPPTSQGFYRVYRKNPSATGVWTQIATTTSLSYVDTITQCNIPISYRIDVVDSSGCISVSSVAAGVFTYLGTIVNAPSLRCVSVLPSGDVQLSWVVPADPDNFFAGYEIYHSNGGAYTLLNAVGAYAQATYTHVGANGNSQVNNYFIKTLSGCTGIAFNGTSDTLSSMLLTATPSLGFATLNWNHLHTPFLATGQGFYTVYRNYNAGGWVAIGTTSALTYVDTIVECNVPIDYRVQIGDNSGCVSISSVDSDVFTYLGTIVDAPSLRCVSVLPSGDVQLSWVVPPDPDNFFAGYEIYHSNGGVYTLLNTVGTYAQSTYAHVGANGNSQVNNYYIKTLSGCTGIAFNGTSDTLSSMLLTATPSLGFATLNWNHLHTPFLTTGQGFYTVYRNYNAGGWAAIGTTSSLTYVDTIAECDVPIDYRVEIGDNSGCVSVSSVDSDVFTYLGELVDAPSLRCVSVELNGDVTINWVIPADPMNFFNGYQVYHATSVGGPYTLINTLNVYAQTSYLHAGANSQNVVNYYYFKTLSGCTGLVESVPSDTLASMKLDVTNTSGIASLSWNPIHNPNLPTSLGTYTVYKEYPATIWTVLGTTNSTNYKDTITVCESIINYRVEIGDASGCTSVSSWDGDLFRDLTPPATPVIDTVSVDPISGIVNIAWIASTSGDTQGYIIYQYNGSSYDSIATNFGLGSVTYINLISNAQSTIETYAIAAFDSCGNLSPFSLPHNTVLHNSRLDICTSSTLLDWNAYNNMRGGVKEYRIFASENGGSFNLVGTVSGSTLNYQHPNLTGYSTYCYYIQAVSGDGLLTASSNQTCIYADILIDPQFNYLRVATVSGANEVLIKSYLDTLADVSGYKIQRAANAAGPWGTIAFVPRPANNDDYFAYKDRYARPDLQSFYYRIIVVDSCDNDKFTSNIGKTIHLKASANDYFQNILEWNDYEEWNGGIESYNIYRVVDGFWEVSPIASVPHGINSYIDDIAIYYESDARFCYYIEAIQGIDSLYSFKDTSLSNEACVIQPVKHYTPNAFTPGGLNPEFFPVQIFIDVNSYNFMVFSRWGEKVFETNNPKEGWKGTFNGKDAPQGAYVYMVEFKSPSGKEFKKRGTVTLIK